MTSSEKLIYFMTKMNAHQILDFMSYINYYDDTLAEKLQELINQLDENLHYER